MIEEVSLQMAAPVMDKDQQLEENTILKQRVNVLFHQVGKIISLQFLMEI